MYDTVKGLDYLGDQDAIEYMCRRAIEVWSTRAHGMPFDRLRAANLQRPRRPYPGLWQPEDGMRACAAADGTGHAMLHTLYQQNVRGQHAVLRALVDGARPHPRPAGPRGGRGHALEMETGEVSILQAKATVLATGGSGALRRQHQCLHQHWRRPSAWPARAGIPLETWSSSSSYPDGIQGAASSSPRACARGAATSDKNGERFMERYARIQGPRQPRRGVASDDHRDQGSAAAGPTRITCCSSSITRPEVINHRAARHREIAIRFANADPVRERSRGATAHYQMGGIPTQVHRASRCGPKRHLESIVRASTPWFGVLPASRCMARTVWGPMGSSSRPGVCFGKAPGAGHQGHPRLPSPTAQPPKERAASRARVAPLDAATSGERVADVGNDLRRTMQAHCGIFPLPGRPGARIEKG